MVQNKTAVFSTADLKKYNYRQVYQTIYEDQQATKQQLVSKLNLSLPTISQNLQELLEAGLIERAGHLSSTGGRKPFIIQAVRTARISIGLEILKEMAHIVAIDLYGALLMEDTLTLRFNNTALYFDTLCKWANNRISRLPYPKEHILGIGIAVQGLPSADNSEIEFGHLLESGVKTNDFAERLDWPCVMVHDVELAALAEIWFHKELTNSIYLSLNRNLGTALIINGSVYTGNNSFSSTIEHMCLIPDGKKCYCGKQGCMETYCSADALEYDAGEQIDQFFFNLRVGRRKEVVIWDNYLHTLALAIDNIRMIIRSDILIGGLLQPYMIPEDFERLTQYVNEITFFKLEDLKIERSHCGSKATAIGGGLYYINHFLQTL